MSTVTRKRVDLSLTAASLTDMIRPGGEQASSLITRLAPSGAAGTKETKYKACRRFMCVALNFMRIRGKFGALQDSEVC